MRALFAAALLATGAAFIDSEAHAACTCQCVNGSMQPLCTSSIDLPPICPVQLCPLTPVGIPPLPGVGLPPLGTTECSQQQVMNPYTRQYEWRRVCR
jgi:hypothetical protein